VRNSKLHEAYQWGTPTLVHLQKIEPLVLFRGDLSRGTGLNFVNDPFATVGENGGTRMRGRRRRWAMGLKGNSWRKKRRKRERKRNRLGYFGGGRGARVH